MLRRSQQVISSSKFVRRSLIQHNIIKDEEINVMTIDFHGQTLVRTCVKDISVELKVHFRDILALGVTPSEQKRANLNYYRHASMLILPRELCIIASVGRIRTIILPHKVIVFNPTVPCVKVWADVISTAIHKQVNTDSFDFELFVLEGLLAHACGNFDRRVVLYKALVKNVLIESELADRAPDNILVFSLLNNILRTEDHRLMDMRENYIYKLAPLHDLLHEFQLELQEAKNAIQTILANDRDTSMLMLSAKRRALQENTRFDETDHEDAEMLLENYTMRISHVLSDVMNLQSKIKNKQQIADLGMKVKRNRLLWLNANLSATAVCVGLGGGVFAAFGMNLVSGFETLPASFYIVNVSTIGVCALIYYRLLKYMHGVSPLSAEQRQVSERKLVETIFVDTNTVDFLLAAAHRKINSKITATGDMQSKLTREEFTEIFREVKGEEGGEVDPKQVDAFFNLMDTNADGIWSMSEVTRRSHDSAIHTSNESQNFLL